MIITRVALLIIGLATFAVLAVTPPPGVFLALVMIPCTVIALVWWQHSKGGTEETHVSVPQTKHSRSIPQWVKIAVATRDGGKCRRCGSDYDLQYDHIIPYSQGGRSDDVNNIQLLCGRCNRLKSNRYVG